MRVCHMTTVHPVQDARIFYRMCQPLTRHGCRVTLIAPGVCDDSLVRMSPFNTQIAQAGRPKRSWLALRAALAEQAQIYHFHDPELIPVGLTLKLLRPSAAVIYDVHEDYPAQMAVKYWIPKWLRPSVARGMWGVNALANRSLDAIVTADPAVTKQFHLDKTLVFYNFPILDFFKDQHVPKQVDIVYLGGMSERTGMLVLLDALALLKARGTTATAHLAGYTDGAEGLALIYRAVRERGLNSEVLVTGRLPHTDVPGFLQSGRMGVVPLQAIAKFLSNIPTKLFEYWACGLPAVASDLPPMHPFLHEGKNSLRFPPDSAPQLAERIDWLLRHPDEATDMGRHGQEQVAKEWNNETQVTTLLGLYERVCGDKSHKEGNGGEVYARSCPLQT